MPMPQEQMPPQGAPAPQGAPSPEGQPMPGGPEQGQPADVKTIAKKTMTAVMNIVYSEKGSEQFIKMIQSAGNPAEGVANAVLMVLDIIQREAGDNAPPQVLVVAVRSALAFLVEIAIKAGLAEDANALAQEAGAIIQQAVKDQGPMPAAQGAPAPQGQPAGAPAAGPGLIEGEM